MGTRINDAVDILQSARRDIRMLDGTPAYTRPLEEAHNAMCDAEAVLEDRVEDEEEPTEDDEERGSEEEEDEERGSEEEEDDI